MKKSNLCLLFATGAITLAAVLFANTEVLAGPVNYEVDSTTYEMSNGVDYDIRQGKSVAKIKGGVEKLGNLTLLADTPIIGSYNGYQAYGVRTGVTFNYSCDYNYINKSNDEWHLEHEDGNKLLARSISGSIRRGAILIEKSYDSVTWKDAANPVTNLFEAKPNGVSNLYTPSGEDLNHGTYYRISVAYRLGIRTKDYNWFQELFGKRDKYDHVKYIEQYKMFIYNDSTNISIHNLTPVSDEQVEMNGLTIDHFKRGETLLDGSLTTTGFSIDKLDKNIDVYVSQNGQREILASDGDEFRQSGRYTIRVKTILGTEKLTTIYVLASNDHGFYDYFEDSIINGKRVFRDGNYPQIQLGAKLNISLSKYLPKLKGRIINNANSNIIDASDITAELLDRPLELGDYIIELQAGNDEAGDVIRYQFRFSIVDQKSKPVVNLHNLTTRNEMLDLQTKHYEVAFETTRGGYVFVCFSLDSFEEAQQYAFDIEKRFIEHSNGETYYKSKNNPNKKILYTDTLKLNDVMWYYAGLNCEVAYFNSTDIFTFRTYNDDLLESLESLNLKESIRVFPSIEEREKLMNRKPYINDFTFVSFASYDSVKVTAYCHRNNQTYDIKYGVNINEQLSVTSRYTITEKNCYGDAITYDVYYMSANQVRGNIDVSSKGKLKMFSLSDMTANFNSNKLYADYIRIKNLANEFDSETIVVVKAPLAYDYELISRIDEINNLILYKEGIYSIKFIDRAKNILELVVEITGNTMYYELADCDLLTYTDAINKTRLNTLTKEKAQTDHISDIIDNLKKVIAKANAKYYYNREALEKLNRIDEFASIYNKAIEVLNSSNSTEEQIILATRNLDMFLYPSNISITERLVISLIALVIVLIIDIVLIVLKVNKYIIIFFTATLVLTIGLTGALLNASVVILIVSELSMVAGGFGLAFGASKLIR